MRLSEAFSGDGTALELVVTSYNINHGLNQPLLGKCPYLNDYSILVGEVKVGISAGLNRREAIRLAVKNCLAKGVMSGYLENHAEEVFNMLALEWNLDDAVALKKIRLGKSFEDIREITELPIETIKKIGEQQKMKEE